MSLFLTRLAVGAALALGALGGSTALELGADSAGASQDIMPHDIYGPQDPKEGKDG